MKSTVVLMPACLAVLLAGCPEPEGSGSAATRPATAVVRVPVTLKPADSLFFNAPGKSAGGKLRRKLGDAEAARAVLSVVGGEGEPVRTLVTNFTWTPAERSVRTRFRLLIPGIIAATVSVSVGGDELWSHSADDGGVLSPWIDGGAASEPVTIRVAGTGAYGTGGVTDIVICHAREGLATSRPATAPAK